MLVMVKKEKILVTGGAGFIGHHLANELLNRGYEVHVWDNLSVGKKERLNPNISFKEMDILSDELPPIDFDIVYHLASPTSVSESLENPDKYKNGCYVMTQKMVDYSINNNVKQFFFSSTAAVYGNTDEFPTKEDSKLNPLSPYATFKLAAEDYITSMESSTNMKFTICRFFNVFGEEQHNQGSYAPAVAIFLKQHYNSEPITVTGDGLQTRDYIYVKDIVNFLVGGIGQDLYNKEVFNLGFGRDLTIKSIAEIFNGEIKYIEERNEPKKSLSDISKARLVHSWEPKTSVIEWIKNIIR
jgi:UDP-glucose 4-epimerase